ncbi:hypothetical protein RB195_004109 [Necator americanus]
MGHEKTKFIGTAILIFIMTFCLTITLLVLFKPIETIPLPVIDRSEMMFLAAIVLHGNGGRSRTEVLNEMMTTLFPNGPSQIAEVDFEDTFNIKIQTHLQNCEVEIKRIANKCGRDPPTHTNWTTFAGFVYECIGLNRESDLFPDAESFSRLESLIRMDRNGLKMPDWFEHNKKQIYSLYERTYSFIVGVNEYHDEKLLKMKQGFLMSKIMKILWKQWEEYEKNGQIKRGKFTAFYTQDWLLLAFLHSLGCGEEALGSTIPTYNSSVIIETYVRSKKPFLKVLYKDNITIPKDVTSAVRSCTFAPCHLIEFSRCCKEYTTDDPRKICDANPT